MEAVKPKAGEITDMAMGPAEQEDRLKGAYADPSKSTITVEIKSGTNDLEPIDLK